MKIRRLLAVAALVALPAWVMAQAVGNDGSTLRPRVGTNPPAAQVQGQVVGGIVRADTSFKALTMSSSGGMSMYDESRDRDNFSSSVIINDTMSVGFTIVTTGNGAPAGFTAESSAVIPSYAYHHFALGIRAIPAANDTTTQIRLAVQIRGHSSSSSDSSNTWAWIPWNVAGPVASSNVDSIGHFAPANGSGFSGTVAGYSGVYSGEFEVRVDPKRGYGEGLTLGRGGYGQSFGAPNGILINLNGPRGEGFWAPYMSVRVRCLTGAAKPRVSVTLMMGS